MSIVPMRSVFVIFWLLPGSPTHSRSLRMSGVCHTRFLVPTTAVGRGRSAQWDLVGGSGALRDIECPVEGTSDRWSKGNGNGARGIGRKRRTAPVGLGKRIGSAHTDPANPNWHAVGVGDRNILA